MPSQPIVNNSFLPPPTHPSLRSTHSSPATYDVRHAVPPRLPPRQPSSATAHVDPIVEEEVDMADLAPGAFGIPGLPREDEGLSEHQLRELYDDEEIDRFLHLFSAYVREARATDGTQLLASMSSAGLVETENGNDAIEGDDESLDETVEDSEPPSPPPRPIRDLSLSERVALDYLVPLLPPAPPPPPAFTLHRLQLTAQRLYLATVPVYAPFLERLVYLATWQDKNTSLFYCAAYWFLWYHNFLLPALILRVLYSLIRRKLLPYPNLEELRQHREEVIRAREFSAAITSRLVTAPTYDVQDVWSLIKDLNNKRKLKKAAKRENSDDSDSLAQDDRLSEEHAEGIKTSNDSTPLANDVDVKRTALKAVNDVADLHERVKNIFLWRRPVSSVTYGLAMGVVFCITLLPSQYLVKLLGLALGALYWHAIPVLAAIPPADRARLPPPFSEVPTDGDYAMELISQRVARGLEIKPRSHRAKSGSAIDTDTKSDISQTGEGPAKVAGSVGLSTSVDWKKWGNRIVDTKARSHEVKKLFKDGQWKRPENWLALNPLSPSVALPTGSIEPRLQTYTFPAQYKKASGLITLASDTLFFTPLLSSSAKLMIPLTHVLGVKKTGPMRGMNLRWVQSSQDGATEEREEKFLWVGARNELFARLVAWGGRRWANI